jgi:hypothetical protein
MKRYDAAERPPFRSFVDGNVTLLFCQKVFFLIYMYVRRASIQPTPAYPLGAAGAHPATNIAQLYISSGVHALCVCVYV